MFKGLLFGEGSMMELSIVIFSAKYWFNDKKSTQNNKRAPYLKTLLQLCASTGTQVYL